MFFTLCKITSQNYITCRLGQYTVSVALNHEKIEKIWKEQQKLKWEGIKFLSKKDDQKKFEKDNVTIALNILYAKQEKIYPAYVSKHNSNREKQVILLMILNGGRWHYLAVKKI